MFLEKSKPNTNGQRWVLKYSKPIIKSNLFLFKKNIIKCKSGRNLNGFITIRHRRNSKETFFKLNTCFFYSNFGLVLSTSSFFKKRIPLVEIIDKFHNIYLLKLVAGLSYGDYIQLFPKIFDWDSSSYLGTKTTLNKLINGVVFCDVNWFNKKKIASSAGTYCTTVLNDYEFGLITISLPSGSIKILKNNFVCTIGRVGYEKLKIHLMGKAGNSFHIGKRPTVRGVAMNPVDHPHGGRTKTNSPEKSPWGWVTKHNK